MSSPGNSDPGQGNTVNKAPQVPVSFYAFVHEQQALVGKKVIPSMLALKPLAPNSLCRPMS